MIFATTICYGYKRKESLLTQISFYISFRVLRKIHKTRGSLTKAEGGGVLVCFGAFTLVL